jgi:DNA-binding transcriptional LysR family regulator
MAGHPLIDRQPRTRALEIQQLRHLLAVIQYGNLRQAAEESNISQSGISRSLKSLETRFGVPLLLRKPRGVTPTVFGLSVARRAEAILNEVAHAQKEVRDLQAARIGEVTLGITHNYAHYTVPDVLVEIYRASPQVRVNVVTGGFIELVERLRTGSIDLAFGLLGPIEDTDEITIASLKEHHSRVVAGAGHPMAGRKVDPAELAKARWITLNTDGFQRTFAQFFHARGLMAPTQVFQTDSLDLIRRTIGQIEALTVVPTDVVHEGLESGTLTVLDCETPAELTRVGIMRRTDRHVTPQMKLLINRLVAAV